MKTNLKTFPYQGNYPKHSDFVFEATEWKRCFEAELREILENNEKNLPHFTLESQPYLYGLLKGRIEAYKEILGEE